MSRRGLGAVTSDALAALPVWPYAGMYLRMDEIRRVTANLPAHLLEDACRTTGKGITETLVRGLELVRRSRALEKARAL